MKIRILTAVAAVAAVSAVAYAGPSFAGMAEAEKWIDEEFQPSTLSKEDQMKEMEWFVNAAEPFQGMEINVLSETIPTHEYESKTLTKAFEETVPRGSVQGLTQAREDHRGENRASPLLEAFRIPSVF